MDFWGGRPVKSNLTTLARHLGELGAWVRLHYVYPYPHVDELIPLMADGKILPYLDIPLQHASPRVLKAMKRPANAANMLERIRGWRRICPELTLRSTFIVGFPGETDGDFEMLLDFLREAEIDRAGCFEYSPVDGAPANELADSVPDILKRDRYELFMETQAEISAAKLARRIGTRTPMLIDDVAPDGTAVGRSFAESPEIDGVITVAGCGDLRVGEFVDVEVQHADEHDLVAVRALPRK
jgi:ribosomal protein S12 methylthiotransferase